MSYFYWLDDGTCQAFTAERSCKSLKSFFEFEKTQCIWDPDKNVCSYRIPSIEVKSIYYILLFTCIASYILNKLFLFCIKHHNAAIVLCGLYLHEFLKIDNDDGNGGDDDEEEKKISNDPFALPSLVKGPRKNKKNNGENASKQKTIEKKTETYLGYFTSRASVLLNFTLNIQDA